MKRNLILSFIAVILLALYAGHMFFLLLVFPLVYFLIKYREKMNPPKAVLYSTEEVEQKYGAPDDVVVLDASRANELSALILFYTEKDLMVVAGEELKISDMVSVMPKNMATPYTIDEYAVIISTKAPQYPTICLRVGYDGGLAREIAEQIDSHILRGQ
jgi:hypothetical protein